MLKFYQKMIKEPADRLVELADDNSIKTFSVICKKKEIGKVIAKIQQFQEVEKKLN